MSDSTPRLGLPDLPDTPELYADTMADAFGRIDAFTDLYLKGQFVNTPPVSPADGDAYLTGGAPTGAWSGYSYKIATCRDGGWVMLTPFNGLRGFVEGSNSFIVYCNGAWIDWNALVSAGESSIASAATCDLGAAGALFLQITGITTITGFGTAANTLRFVRFAGALALTYNATSLILPGAANIATAAGDTACFTSDGSGNWRCRTYQRANGNPVTLSSPNATGTLGMAGDINVRLDSSTFQPVLNIISRSNAGPLPALTWDVTNGIGETPSRKFAFGAVRYQTNGRGALVWMANDADDATNAGSSDEVMRLTSEGRLFLGYTTSNGSYRLQVNSQIFATSSTVATSHGPYKQDQQPLSASDCLARVEALVPKSFKWIAGAGEVRDADGTVLREAHNFPGGTQIGFIAQEVQAALEGTPFQDAVVKSNIRAAPKDQEGNIVGEDENFLGIAEGNLIALLVGGLKEIAGKLRDSEVRIAALEAAHAAG